MTETNAGPRRTAGPREGLIARGRMDVTFLVLTLVLVAIGLVVLFSSSYAVSFDENNGNSTYYIGRQLIFAGIGIAAMFVASLMNYQFYRALSFPLLAFSILMLVLVLFVGVTRNGSKRWLDLGITEFEPSEVAKLAVILCFASLISMFREKMKTFRYGILPFVGIIGVIGFLMSRQPHYSGAIIIALLGAAMLFMGGVHWGWFVAGFGTLGVVGAIAATRMDYIVQRLAIWRDPWIDERNIGWQTIQSLYALGSGGLLGLGLGNSRQKFSYLPEESNDYIFSIACEELGFIGGFIILLLFALLIIRGYWLALHARDRFGSLIIAGITTMMALQVFLNIAVVTNLIPVTGISLPFFSYGGTALILQLVQVGIVLSVSRQSRPEAVRLKDRR